MARFTFACILIFTTSAAFSAALYSGPRKSFWLKKQKVMTRIIEDRYIVTSVSDTRKHFFGSKRRLEIKGVSIVNAPRDYSFTKAQRFEELGLKSGFVRGIKYDALGGRIDVKAASYGYTTSIALKVFLDREKKEISWKVIEGVLVGMTGVFVFEKYADQKTYISLFAHYEYKKLSIPRFFVSFALEVALKKLASEMRSQIEQDYKSYVND